MQSFKYILIFFLFISSFQVFGQEIYVKWMTWEEAVELNKDAKKKIFVDVYTDWCGWCKKMDKATFQQPHIARFMNEHYYNVKFNAEQKEDIRFNEKLYKFVRTGRRGYHELAAEITMGKLSYPTVVFLDEDLKILQPVPGYQDPQRFERIITYFAMDHFKSTPWKKYLTNYKPITQ